MKKILIGIGSLLAISTVAAFLYFHAQAAYTKVVTGKVFRQDLATVISGTGQIKPKTYVNLGATAMGRVTHFAVKEGDVVKKGETVATIENVQPKANVAAQQATISAARTDIGSSIANEKTAEANVERAKADLTQKNLDWKRAQQLYQEQLISKQDYDSKQAAYDTDVASVAQEVAALNQAKAQTDSARGHLQTQQAMLRVNQDVLDRTLAIAPFDGIVTNEPIREGETVVEGIQNTEGSTLMTLADMSVITAEVKVDETDIVNVQLGQSADVTVDALPGKVFKGHVTLVGDQAILRSTGIATSQSTTGAEEAKDFKVVITLDETSPELRPGFSTTAKITTAKKSSILTLPIQALTMHSVDDDRKDKNGKSVVDTGHDKTPALQGVFVVREEKRKKHAVFVPVTTGITGATEIEVLSGLKEGDEIVVGPYKTLRTLRNDALIKPDATPDTKS